MTLIDFLSVFCIVTGCGFFIAGSVGLLRFPDLFTRLHTLTKADNMGLGLVILGLMLQTPSIFGWFKLLAIWLLIQISGASAANTVAHNALRKGIKPWKQPTS